MKRIFIISFLAGILGSCSPEIVHNKYEFRGAWVATVKNIDWPSKAGLDEEKQKSEFREITSYFEDAGLNAILFQVRPATDTYYESETEQWSQWLQGKQGEGPGYDPLKFIIEESHSKGLEFHAWFNPYRAVMDIGKTEPALNHISNIYPGWFLQYGTHLYFDPGIPEVREYLNRVISEVVENYDVDAIHFDDYFYPYKIAGQNFPDSVSFKTYGGDYESIEDWRRDNVNQLVKSLNETIKSKKPWVKFGISPFGVWRNVDKDPTGSNTRAGVTNYDDLYADIVLWLKEGWIDYVTPQLYWPMGFSPADYSILVDWWAKNTYQKQLYIGEATYRIKDDPNEAWKNPMEMPKHLRLSAKYQEVQGNVYFNTTSVLQNKLGFSDSLRTDFYRYPALTPPMSWIDDSMPSAPENVTAYSRNSTVVLNWDKSNESNGKWIIYRFKGSKVGNIQDPRNILTILSAEQHFYADKNIYHKGKYTYLITQLDRMNNESAPSSEITVKIK